jgi:hypothetical protein
VVYLKTDASQAARPLDAMRREVARLMQTAGYDLEWRGPQDSNIETGAFLAVVELRGDCEAASGDVPSGSTVSDVADLASTYISDGQVLPFSWVNCGNVSRLLAPALLDQRGREEFLLGRAVGRVIAHEIYHMLMQTRGHTRNGISKPCFSAADLLAGSFEFEDAALAQLQRGHAGRSAEASEPVSAQPGSR